MVARPPRVPPRESLAPRHVAIGIPLAGRAQHLERGAGIGDHPEVEARARINLSGVDVDSHELCVRMKTRRIAVGDDVVHAGPEHEDQVCFAEGGGARREKTQRVILADHPSALGRREEGDSETLDEGLECRFRL